MEDAIYYGQSTSWFSTKNGFPETAYGTLKVFNILPVGHASYPRAIQELTTQNGNLWVRFITKAGNGVNYGQWTNLNKLGLDNVWSGLNTFNKPVVMSNDLTVGGNLNASAANLTNLFVGQITFFPCTNAPNGWLKAHGGTVSRASYPLLWAFAQSSGALVSEADWNNGRQGCFSMGNGTSIFRIPDLRGEFLRGLDDGRGVDSGRALGSAQGDAIRNITGYMISPRLIGAVKEAGGVFSADGWNPFGLDASDAEGGSQRLNFDASRVVPTANENRPRNISLLACIRYQ